MKFEIGDVVLYRNNSYVVCSEMDSEKDQWIVPCSLLKKYKSEDLKNNSEDRYGFNRVRGISRSMFPEYFDGEWALVIDLRPAYVHDSKLARRLYKNRINKIEDGKIYLKY